jgi:hypothetical protein
VHGITAVYVGEPLAQSVLHAAATRLVASRAAWRTRMRSTAKHVTVMLGLLLGLAGCAGDGNDKSADPKHPDQPSLQPADDPIKHQTPPTVPDMPHEVELPGLDGAEFAAIGDRAFETAKDIGESSDDAVPGVSRGGAFGNNAQGAATGALAPSAETDADEGARPPSVQAPQQSNSTPDAMREIVEADVVQAEGDILYVLNRYRGLLLIDMSDPDAPFVKGRVPFQAQPVDMYLRDGRAYVVVSDYFNYWQYDSDSDPLGFHGSQILVVDVSNAADPAMVGSFDVDGEVTDTRIVGDVLYAVSKRNPEYWRYDTYEWEDTTWVMSIDVADPTHIAEVDRAEFDGSANIVQVYEDALSIAAIDPNYYLVDDANAQQTLITYVDISDPKGRIQVGDGAYVPGAVADKFKMDLFEGHLRVISNDGRGDGQSAGTLTVFDAGDPAKLAQSAQIELAGAGAGTGSYVASQATRYAGADLFVNLCWYLPNSGTQNCRLDLYDVGKPAAPAKVGDLAVDGPVTHFEVRGDRLLSLGYHPIQNGQYQNFVQVALYDVADLAHASRLSAVDLGANGSSSSSAQQDYKAFKVLDELNMILLPLSWSEVIDNNYHYHTGSQILDWKDDALVEQGKTEQRGEVERAIAFKDRVVSISTEEVQVIDASNRAAPVATADLFLVRNVVDVFDIEDHQIQLGYDEDDSSFRFFVLPFGADDMADSVAELPIDISASYQMQTGDVIHLVGYAPSTGKQLIKSADFSDPVHPRWRGTYAIGDDIDHIWSGGGYYGYASYYDYYWNPSAGQPLNNELLAVTTRVVNTDDEGRRFYKNYLKIIDLRDPDDLHLADGSVELPDWGFVNRVKHGDTLYSMHAEPALDADGNPKKYHERWFVDRVDASDPDRLTLLDKVNVPGQLVDVDDTGTIWYTVDYQWDEHGRRRNSLNVLHVTGDEAVLTAVLPVGDEIDRARYLDREVWFSTHSYPWWGRMDDSPDSRQPYTRLTRLRVDEAGAIASDDAHDVSGYHFDLLDVEGATVYLASSYPTGLLTLDTTDFANPRIVSTARTIGYVSKIVHKGDYLYMPMGSYGVRRAAAK